jgi:phosphoribosylformylglycinamidine cyclo-ligase
MPAKSAKPVTYAQAGVSIKTADQLVDHLKSINPAIGGFSGMVPLPTTGYKKPYLVASTDGVGTKLLLALRLKKLETVGIDLVAMSVNDLIVCGARPLLFLDYYATSKLRLNQARTVLAGIVEGCRLAGCPLLGGETAEMPGMYQNEDLDLAGFAVGIVDQDRIIDGKKLQPGDAVIGLSSNGLHSNGYSLARKVLGEEPKQLSRKPKSLGGASLAQALLAPTRIYCSAIIKLLDEKAPIRAMAHITGGGLPGNLNRVLPDHLDAVIQTHSWAIPPLFEHIESEGPVERQEMYRTFNMGIGFVLVVPKKAATKVLARLEELGEQARILGEIVADGEARVQLV